jgi:hypothetical protein
MDPNIQKQVLDEFGRLFITSVRNPAVQQLKKIIRGEMKGVSGQRFKDLFKDFTPEQLSAVDAVTEFAIDAALHNLLFSAEEHKFDLQFKSQDGKNVNLADVSDGLSGELYTEDGWISRFS